MVHDTHAHLDFLLEQLNMVPEFDRNNATQELTFDHDRLDTLLSRHEFIIQATISGRNFGLTRTLFQQHNKVSFLFGYHPEEVVPGTVTSEVIIEQETVLQQAVMDSSLVGIGEIGLDYFWSDDSEVWRKQVEIFDAHLHWARQHDLGVCVHIRDKRGEATCMDDGLAILANYPGVRFVVHCFTGNQSHADKILGMGGHLGFGGIITYNSGKEILGVAKNCPHDRFLLETDLPFLAPTPKRGEVCLPEYIEYVGQALARVKNSDEQTIWQHARQNAKNLFGL